MAYDHWNVVPSDPLEPGTLASAFVAEIRNKKGLNEQVVPISIFEDML